MKDCNLSVGDGEMLEVERTSARIIVLVGRNFTVATNEMVKIFISYGDGVRVRLCLFVCV